MPNDATKAASPGEPRKAAEVGDICLQWWQDMEDDTGGRAQLRRADTILDLFTCRRALLLARRLRDADVKYLSHEKAAVAAYVLAHVREHAEAGSIGKLMGRIPERRSTPVVSDLRFRRFAQTKDLPDLMQAGRRIVAMLGGKADVAALGELMVFWGMPSTMKKLAFDYYDAADNS